MAARKSMPVSVGRMHKAAEAVALHSHGQVVTLDAVMSLYPFPPAP